MTARLGTAISIPVMTYGSLNRGVSFTSLKSRVGVDGAGSEILFCTLPMR